MPLIYLMITIATYYHGVIQIYLILPLDKMCIYGMRQAVNNTNFVLLKMVQQIVMSLPFHGYKKVVPILPSELLLEQHSYGTFKLANSYDRWLVIQIVLDHLIGIGKLPQLVGVTQYL